MKPYTTFEEIWNKCDSLSSAEKEEIKLKVDLIGKLIDAREQRHLTQQELADMCGVKQPFIARLERGNIDPQLTTMIRVLKPLGYKLAVISEAEEIASENNVVAI
ncbi:MAG: helix-turn-helix domain-containing protein [Candidatus Eremiobacterota bacterium]